MGVSGLGEQEIDEEGDSCSTSFEDLIRCMMTLLLFARPDATVRYLFKFIEARSN